MYSTELNIASHIGWAMILQNYDHLSKLEKECIEEFKKHWRVFPPETDFTHNMAVCEVLGSIQECELFVCK